MAPPRHPSSSRPGSSSEHPIRREAYGDPWQAFGYLVAGVLFYGLLGWLLDRWLDTSFFVVAGIFVGAGLGIYMTFGRFGGTARSQQAEEQADERANDQDRREREE
jgi:ATP synthase protein I